MFHLFASLNSKGIYTPHDEAAYDSWHVIASSD